MTLSATSEFFGRLAWLPIRFGEQIASRRRLTMIAEMAPHVGIGPSEQGAAKEVRWTRRAFGGLVLGGLSSAGPGFMNTHEVTPSSAPWNPMVQTACLGDGSRRAIPRLATLM